MIREHGLCPVFFPQGCFRAQDTLRHSFDNTKAVVSLQVGDAGVVRRIVCWWFTRRSRGIADLDILAGVEPVDVDIATEQLRAERVALPDILAVNAGILFVEEDRAPVPGYTLSLP